MKEIKDNISFEEAKDIVFTNIKWLGWSLISLKEKYKDTDYLDDLIIEVRNKYKSFKSGDFEIFYENISGLSIYIIIDNNIPKTEEFFQDFVKYVNSILSGEELERFWKEIEYRKKYFDERQFVIDTLIREKNKIRFDVDIL